MELNVKPTKKQWEAWQYLEDDKTKFVGFGGGAGSGKSFLICEWLLIKAIQYPGMRAFIARKELKRLMNSTFITFQKVSKHHNVNHLWKLDGKYNVIHFTNGSTIDLLDVAYKPTDPEFERFGSLEYTFGAIDEAGEVHFKAFDILKSRVGRHNIFNDGKKQIEVMPKMLITFNPTKNWVYQIFYKPYKEGKLPPEYALVLGLYTDNPYTAKMYGEQLSQLKDKVAKQRLMYGNWEYEDEEGALVKSDYIRDLFTNVIDKSPQKYMSVDVARYGSDRIVINLWQGLESYKREYFQKMSVDETAQIIRDLSIKEKIPFSHIIVDEDGVGGGVVDILKGVKGFIANSAPLSTQKAIRRQVGFSIDRPLLNFQNLKSQCGFKLAEMIEEHKIAVKNASQTEQDEIFEELSAVLKQKDPDKEGKLALVPKSEVKEILGRSPDIADTFLMRMYFELFETPSLSFSPSSRIPMRPREIDNDYI